MPKLIFNTPEKVFGVLSGFPSFVLSWDASQKSLKKGPYHREFSDGQWVIRLKKSDEPWIFCMPQNL